MKDPLSTLEEFVRVCFIAAILPTIFFVELANQGSRAQTPGECATHPKKFESDQGCFRIEDLARRWPPANAQIAFLDEVNQELKTFDFAGVPFNKVKVLSWVCVNLPGRGQEAYIAFETAETSDEGRAVLALINNRAGKLELIGPLGPADTDHAKLTLDDVNGDGQPEIIFTATDAIEIWGWKKGSLVFLLRSNSNYPYELKYAAGDGNCLLVIWRKSPGAPHAEGLRWPAGAYRWVSDGFEPVLVPGLYAEPLAAAEQKLAQETSTQYLIAAGEAYENLGKTEQAREKFGRAWDIHQKDPPPPPCSEPGDAVQDYYDAINEGDLVRAYKHLAPELQKGFVEFAAGFARTQSVTIIDLGRAQAGTTGIAMVPVTIRASDLTAQGPVARVFAGSWRVRRSDCALLGARMHKISNP